LGRQPQAGVNRLGRRIAARIEAAGPITVADYMATCLFDPEDGYYTTREPFGVEGDFTTAPEISQMFGELAGVWVIGAWEALGRPLPFRLTEIGPGRGTLMQDMLRVIARLSPDLAAGLEAVMVEASPRLAALQATRLKDERVPIRWESTLDEAPDRAGAIVANELFDAIATRQFVRTPNGWRERVVALDAQGSLVFAAGNGGIDPSLLPPDAALAQLGAIFEIAPAREAMTDRIAAALNHAPGMALLIDYGHLQSGIGDTLQAVRRHGFADPLEQPGEADLTSHVDFEALGRVARAAGLGVRLMTQAKFLLGMGLLERAGSLGAHADPATRERLQADVERLAGPTEMGSLFKAMLLHPEGMDAPPSHASD
jgi:SAM-dependent MidA family methyltransferase